VYSTYLGNAGDVGFGIAVESSGNAYVTGFTDSGNFPTLNALQSSANFGGEDPFVTSSTTLARSCTPPTSVAAISIRALRSQWIHGRRVCDRLHILDQFPHRESCAGGNRRRPRLRCICDRDQCGDVGQGIAVDGSGNAYVTGYTTSMDFPTVNPLQAGNTGSGGNVFVTEINAAGSALVFSTYLGCSGRDQGQGIALDGQDAFVLSIAAQ
jgi:hypothetical protein